MALIALFPARTETLADYSHELPLTLQDLDRARSTFLQIIARCQTVEDCLRMRTLIRAAVARVDEAADIAIERADRLCD